jgi:hypothetical protein
MRCAVKGADVSGFEYWLESICNNGDDNNDYVASVILQMRARARTSYECINLGEKKMLELKATTTR